MHQRAEVIEPKVQVKDKKTKPPLVSTAKNPAKQQIKMEVNAVEPVNEVNVARDIDATEKRYMGSEASFATEPSRSEELFDGALFLPSEPVEQELLGTTFGEGSLIVEEDSSAMFVEYEDADEALWQLALSELGIDSAELVEEETEWADFLAQHAEIAEDFELSRLTEDQPNINEPLAELLERLEPEVVEEVKIIIEAVAETVSKIQEISEAGSYESAEAVQELEKLCMELLEQLNINYTDETIKKFIMMLIHTKPSNDAEEPTEFINFFIEEGTHEQKKGYASVLNILAQLKIPQFSPIELLGRLALSHRAQ